MKRSPLKRKTALRRKPWRKALGTAEQRLRFKQAVLEADGDCVMRGFHVCDGPLDACHILPKQRLRRMHYGANVIYSVDAAFIGCRKAHADHDSGKHPIPDSLIPERCRRFAVQYGRGIKNPLSGSRGAKRAGTQRRPG